MVSRNERFVTSIIDAFGLGQSWSEIYNKKDIILENCSPSEVKHVLMTEKVYNKTFFTKNTQHTYYMDGLFRDLCRKFPSLGDKLLESEVEAVRVHILEGCLFSDLKVLDRFANSGTSAEKRQVVKVCSISSLRQLTKDKDCVVRKIAFERLGPVECLDEMLDDKMAVIRAMGAHAAPYGYKKIGEIIMKEIARSPFSIMITKVPRESLPLILANRNIKDKWIAKVVQQRMDQ